MKTKDEKGGQMQERAFPLVFCLFNRRPQSSGLLVFTVLSPNY